MKFNLQTIATYLTLAAVFLLPWQTRYIFWQPQVGSSLSEYGNLSLYATQILFCAAAALWFVAARARHAVPLRSMPWLTIAPLMIILVVNVALSANIIMTLSFLIQITFALLAAYALHQTAQSHRTFLAYAFGFGLIAPVIFGLYQVYADTSPAFSWLGLAARDAQHLGDAVFLADDQRILRAYGSFPHPNIFGGYLAAAVFLIIVERARHAMRLRSMPWLVGLLSLGLLATLSRSALLALVVAGAIWLTLRVTDRKLRNAIIGTILMLPITIWLLQLVAPTLLLVRGTNAFELRSIDERIAQLITLADAIRYSPWFGSGVGAYPALLAKLAPNLTAWSYQPVHNVALLFLGEIGPVGLIGPISLGFLLRKKLLDLFRMRPLLVPVCAFLFSLSLFDHYLWTLWPGQVLVALLLVFSTSKLAALDSEC